MHTVEAVKNLLNFVLLMIVGGVFFDKLKDPQVNLIYELLLFCKEEPFEEITLELFM